MNTQIIPGPSRPHFLGELEKDPSLRSPHTRIQYASAIGKFERWRDGRPLTVTLLEGYLALLQQEGASPATVKQSLAAVRWLARRAVKISYEEQPRQQAEEFERDVERLLKVSTPRGAKPLPTGRHMDEWEIESLLAACEDGTPQGVRDAAMISVASATAIRNEELRSLKISDILYAPDGGAELTIRHGKGDKPRVVDLYGVHLARLTRWIEVRGVAGEYIFTRIRKGGQVDTHAPLSYEGTRLNLLRRFRASALTKTMTWHDFRRTTIGRLFDKGVDLSTIMDITGHASPETAKRYDRRPADRRKEALREIQGETVEAE